MSVTPKVSRTFKVGRFSVLPVFEVFNVNNSDAIISYVTTNALAATYLTPNSIMQGRMYGLGPPFAGKSTGDLTQPGGPTRVPPGLIDVSSPAHWSCDTFATS
jgi:hypothetical protein